ncbi:MAG: FadR/GntR family transcriptional regulator [Syntrophomonas sp.]
MYQPISRASEAQSVRLYEIIIKRLKNMILEGKLKVGDKLPSERELAEMFQVSRVPVREALKIMEFMELIQYIPGDGIYLKYVDINDLLSKIDFMIETSSDIISDLFEARQAIELKAVELAAINRTDADLLAMDKIIKDMEEDINKGGDGVNAATNFHTAISMASKNKVIARINDLLINLTVISREKSLKRNGEATIALVQHKQILEMIKKQNAKEATNIMKDHLEHNKQAALADKNELIVSDNDMVSSD